MNTGNLFDAIPSILDIEDVGTLVKNESVHIERIISKGHSSPANGWYDQENDEWVLVLRGAAIISFKDKSDISLSKGDYINIPAHTLHRVKWTDPETETVWLAIHYSND